MNPFESFYDLNHDGRLTGYERVRYEDDNFAYPGSLVPDAINEKRRWSLWEDDDDECDDDSEDSEDWSFDLFEEEQEEDDPDSCLDYYEPEAYCYDDLEDFGEEEQYWAAPKNADDIAAAIEAPCHMTGVRLTAHRCYNCKHWDETIPATCTRGHGCNIFYDKRIDRDLDDWIPDDDREVCRRFAFRHGDHG